MENSEIDTSVFFYLQPNLGGDSLRSIKIVIENVTAQNLYSFTDIFKIGTYTP